MVVLHGLAKVNAGDSLFSFYFFSYFLTRRNSEVGALFSDLGHFLSLNWKTIFQSQFSQKCCAHARRRRRAVATAAVANTCPKSL